MTNTKLAEEHVVVLDDLEKWRKVATNNLTHYGCNNITYFKTKEGIITTYNPRTTIALLDINLDIQDEQNREGLKVCQFFKQTSPNITIVVMSSLENIATEAKERGADFIIRKSNFVQDFDTFVNQYTNKS